MKSLIPMLVLVLVAIIFLSGILSWRKNGAKKKRLEAFHKKLETYANEQGMTYKAEADSLFGDPVATHVRWPRVINRVGVTWIQRSTLSGLIEVPETFTSLSQTSRGKASIGITFFHYYDFRMTSFIPFTTSLEPWLVTQRKIRFPAPISLPGETKSVNSDFDKVLMYVSETNKQAFVDKPEIQNFLLQNSSYDFEYFLGKLFISAPHEFSINQIEKHKELLAELAKLLSS